MINRIIEKFREEITNKSIQTILNIPISKVINDDNELYIDVPFISKKNDEIHITLKYIHKYKSFYLHFLPPELNQIIASFMKDTIYLEFIISYPKNYPFISPYWSLNKCSSSIINTTFNLSKYYQNKLDYHNQINQRLTGTPSIYPEKDILGFIVIINHFDNIFNILRDNLLVL